MKSERTVKMNIKATLQDVDRYCEKAEKLLRENNLDNYVFSVQMLLREALTNAVVHGCRMDPDLEIKSCFKIFEDCITIVVEDSGDGFDWKLRKNREYALSSDSGRGLLVLDKYASEYEYNETGNIVRIKMEIV